MNKTEKIKRYAVLMDVVFFNPSVVAYVPKRLIEGTLEYDQNDMMEYFLDEFSNQYLEMRQPDVIGRMAVKTVGYIITEEELVQKYSQSLFQDEQDMRSAYYKECSAQAHFGFYVFSDVGEEYVQTLDVDFIKFMDCFVEFPELIKTRENLLFDQMRKEIQSFSMKEKSMTVEKESQVTGYVVFSKEDMEEILALEDVEIVKKKIQEAYYNMINGLQEYIEYHESQNCILRDIYFENCEDVNEEEIRRFFDLTYKAFVDVGELSEFREGLQQFDKNLDNLLSFLTSFSENNGFSFSFDDAFIYRLSLMAGEVLKMDDLERAKKTLCASFREEAKNIDKLALQYLQLLEKKSCFEEDNILDAKLNAKRIKEYLDEVVIGQDTAKKKVISTVIRNALTDDYLTKNTCLLIGPTGSGKTLLARTISEYLEKPIVFIDSTQLTMQGYKGHDLEEYLIKLLDITSGDQERAENGVIVFDEIDKKATNGGLELDGFSKGVMDMLLSFIEGTTYKLLYQQRNISFDTSKLTIFATGSFEEMVKKMKNEQKNGYTGGKIGFHASSTIENEIRYPIIEEDDLIKYGNVPPELTGRIPIIVQLDAMTKETLKEIMTSSRGSVLLSEKRVFEKLGVELRWTDGYLDKIAERAIKKQTGARSLKKEIEASVEEARLEVNIRYFEGNRYVAVVLHEGTVIDPLDCEFIDLGGNSVSLKELRNQEELNISKKKVKKM